MVVIVRTFVRLGVVAGAAGALLLGAGLTPVSAGDDVHVVKPGQSIQRAIDRADPGDTVRVKAGVYRESLFIDKRLTLEGSGSNRNGTVLKPPARRGTSPCNSPGDVQGVCVSGKFDQEFNLLEPVRHVTVTGLVVTRFSGSGVLAFGTRGLEVTDVRASRNGGYGLAGFDGTRSEFTDDVTNRNHEAGLYMGDSRHAGNLIADSTARGNQIGVFMRDSTGFVAEDNDLRRNCAGVIVLATSRRPSGDHEVVHNKVLRNRKACAAEEGAPPLSGIGILLAGVDDVTVEKNLVLRNRPSGTSVESGGVILVRSPENPRVTPDGNLVKKNVVLRNRPVDLLWDETGRDNVFKRNVCRTSDPSGLCRPHHGR
jgi:nitrous oxidase accessory protein NosD